jgi:hypothetical protein
VAAQATSIYSNFISEQVSLRTHRSQKITLSTHNRSNQTFFPTKEQNFSLRTSRNESLQHKCIRHTSLYLGTTVCPYNKKTFSDHKLSQGTPCCHKSADKASFSLLRRFNPRIVKKERTYTGVLPLKQLLYNTEKCINKNKAPYLRCHDYGRASCIVSYGSLISSTHLFRYI